MFRKAKYHYIYIETHDGTGHIMAHTAAGTDPQKLQEACVEAHEQKHATAKAKVFLSKQLEEREFSQIVRAIEDGSFNHRTHSPYLNEDKQL